ncbi:MULTISPECIES: hypothetical protein [unclassified Microbacterium]|uniref:hypothetical protein n=1 Tax=unclassified Microbacterium TaxID=2609290 RepID=UPI000EA911ED|nr:MULTISPECIES: hypothetical protein [unclassified Microbacterium]MBT2483789.1 hypothetical protein [Microbacterium sp. ISL-108]RKN66775.1 hypothetical protein D7252_03650 [Microbacterium sp. CGR2]
MSTEMETRRAQHPTRTARALNFLHRAWIAELRVYSSVGRAIARRPAVPAGATGIGYHQPVLTVLIIFIVLSAVEIPILDLIVHQWPAVRIPILILGIWGLTWMIGLLCAMLMRPHAVGPDGIRVRSGLEIDVPVSWDDIASVAIAKRVDEPKQPRITEISPEDGFEYAERMQDETNIEIELERPVSIRLPGLHPRGGAHPVTRIRLWADDPRAFLAAARPFLTAPS